MKTFLTISVVLLCAAAMSAQGEEYKSEAKKKLEAELAIRAAIAAKKPVVTESPKTETRSERKYLGTYPANSNEPRYKFVGRVKAVSPTIAANQNQSESIQSVFNNADWGTPSYSTPTSNYYTPTETSSTDKPSGSRFWKAMKVIGGVAVGYALVKTIADGGYYVPQQYPQYPQFQVPVLPSANSQTNLLSTNSITTGNIGNQNVFMRRFGNTTFGNVGNESLFLNQIGNTTIGNIGQENVFLNRLGNTTIGDIGQDGVFLNKMGNTTIGNIGNQSYFKQSIGGITFHTIGGETYTCQTAGISTFCN